MISNDNSEEKASDSPWRRRKPHTKYAQRLDDVTDCLEICDLMHRLAVRRREIYEGSESLRVVRASEYATLRNSGVIVADPVISEIRTSLKEIGQRLNGRGGIGAMLRAYRWVQGNSGDTAAFRLDKIWHGIGDWLA